MQRNESVLVLSIDYDGCLAGTSFNARYHEIQDLQRKHPEEYQKKLKVLLSDIHQPLITHIRALVDKHFADEVVVMVGSNRQLAEINKNNQSIHNNGSCYETLPLFAEMLQVECGANVSIHPYTLGDSIHDQPDGSQFHWNQAETLPAETDVTKEASKVLIDFIRDRKHFLLYQQIMLQCSLHANADVVFAFYDDSPLPLVSAANQFARKGIKPFLPSNLKHIEVVCYQDDKDLRALPSIIDGYLKQGESRLKSFLIKDCLRLTDVLIPHVSAWLELTEKYQHEIEALQAKYDKLVAAKAQANHVYRSQIDEKIFSVPEFRNEFDRARRSVEEFLDSRNTSDELSLKYKKASVSADTRDFVYMLSDGAFINLLNANPGLRDEVKALTSRYREKKTSATNSSEASAIKAPLTHIEAKSLVTKLQLNALRCITRKHLQELESARQYLESINDNALIHADEMLKCLRDINASMVVAQEKTKEELVKLNDDPVLANDDSNSDGEEDSGIVLHDEAEAMSTDLQLLWKSLKALCDDVQTKLIKDDADKLHGFYARKVVGQLAIQDCYSLFINSLSRGRFVRACMTEDIWHKDGVTPGIDVFHNVLLHTLALDNLQTLLSSEPYVNYCQNENASKTLKKIADLLMNRRDHLNPMEMMAEINQLAVNKMKAKKSLKGRAATFFSGRKSSRKSATSQAENRRANDCGALFALLEECDSTQLAKLIDMNAIYENLTSHGAESVFEKQSLRKSK